MVLGEIFDYFVESERHDIAEASTSSDLLHLHTCTDLNDRGKSSDNIADSGSSNMPGSAEAACISATAAQDQPKICETSFEVCFSNNPPGITVDLLDPPGKTSVPPVLSVETYKQSEVNHIKRARDKMKKIFTDMTKNRLREMFPDEKMCEQLADTVMDGEEVMFNGISSSSFICSKKISEPPPPPSIYEYYRYWKTIESYQCLLITAPMSEIEISKRDQEMNKFCSQAFLAEFYDMQRLSEIRRSEEVRNCDDIRKIIEDFFQREDGIRAKRALHALIVFFGEGLEQGCLGVWQEHAGMPLKDIVSLVHYETEEARKRYPIQLPVNVEIIFAQCYGHLYGEVEQSDRFKVIAFTNDRYAYTCSIRDTSDPDRNVTNLFLKSYTENTLRPKICQMEASRQHGSVYQQNGENQPDIHCEP